MMNDITSNNRTRFHPYLPGIFQPQAEKEGEPLHALLTIFDELVGRVEQGLERAQQEFEPYSATSEFLELLAYWVALPLDDDWEGLDQSGRKSYLISHAAELYQLRGTAVGLQYMLKSYHDLDAEILEWTWPANMQVGVTSTIGFDCTIMDQPALSRCFVLVLRLNQEERELMAPYVDLYPTNLVGHNERKGVSIPMFKDTVSLEDKQADEGRRFVRKLEKIKTLIENEKPAHTRCYVMIEDPRSVRKPTPIEAMTIGVHSTIASCVIT